MHSLGFRYALLSAASFALMTACVKVLYEQGMPILELIAARAAISLAISYADIKRKKISPWGTSKPLLIARGSVGAASLYCVYSGVSLLPLAEATLIQYLHPAITAVIAVIVLKEAVKISTWFSVAICFTGLILIVFPQISLEQASNLSILGIYLAAFGALGSAIAYVIVKKLSNREDSSVIIFYFPLTAFPISIVLLGSDFVMPQGWQWLLILAVGIFTQLGQIGLTKAMKYEKASRVTAYSYVQVLFATGLGWLIFNQVPTLWSWVGGAFIFIGIIINALPDHK